MVGHYRETGGPVIVYDTHNVVSYRGDEAHKCRVVRSTPQFSRVFAEDGYFYHNGPVSENETHWEPVSVPAWIEDTKTIWL